MNNKKYPCTNYKNGRDKIQPKSHEWWKRYESTYIRCSTISLPEYDKLSTSDDILYYNVFGALDYDVLISDSYVHYNM